MEENNGLNMRNWGYYEPSHKGHLGLQLMSSVAERNTKSIPSGRESTTVMVTSNGDFHHRDCGVPQSSVSMDYMRDSWINHREKFLHLLSGNQNFTVLSEQPETHPLQILQPPDSPKDEKMAQMEEAGSKNDGPLKKRRGGRSPKEPKAKKAKRVPVAPKGEGKPGKKTSGVSINGMGIDISDIPIPICSCTGAPQQCYRWGCGGWQSACCTRSMSLYPLPTSTKRRGARIAGRKMSQGAFSKVLERLVAEGYNLSNPIDLRTHWAKHGTNKFVTIR